MGGYQRGIWRREIKADRAVTGAGTGFPRRLDRDPQAQPTVRALAAPYARVLQEPCPSENRGRRESRVRAAPAVSRARCAQEHAHEHTGSSESIRPSLLNGFTAYSALPSVTGLFATVASQMNSRDLTPASGRQDHTSSPSASAALVSRSFYVHRIPPRVS